MRAGKRLLGWASALVLVLGLVSLPWRTAMREHLCSGAGCGICRELRQQQEQTALPEGDRPSGGERDWPEAEQMAADGQREETGTPVTLRDKLSC